MKTLIILSFSILISLGSYAQQAVPADCPKIEINAPKNNVVPFHSNTIVSVDKLKVEKGLEKNLSYQWSVYNGTMSDKGNRKNIQINPTGFEGQKMIVALKVTGLNEACPSTASIELDIVPAVPVRVETKIVGRQY